MTPVKIGLLLPVAKAKGKGAKSEDDAPEPEADSSERAFAKEAFSAVQDDDEEGFVEAFIAAVKACSSKARKGDYDDDKE